MRLQILDKPMPLPYAHMREAFSIVEKNPDIIYTQLTPVDASVPVFCPCTGIEHIKAPKVVNLYDKEWLEWNVFATAEHTFFLILAVAKNGLHNTWSDNVVRLKTTPMSWDLHGRRILIVGYGRVGRQVGRLAKAFGMTVDTIDKGVAWELTKDKLSKADVISFHVPLNDETEGMVDATWFGAMQKDAIVVNTSRSGIFNEKALASGSRKVRMAIDVAEGYDQDTLDCFKGIITPHVAGWSDKSREATDLWILEKMLDYKERHK